MNILERLNVLGLTYVSNHESRDVGMALIIVTECISVSMGSRWKVFENDEEAFHSGKLLKNLTEQLKLIKV
uniref:Uncharacterized protein n=1 Tax=Vespula pensylvanica TaxID=30213 RepID=A0A834P1Z9_VESPE|nr:hypothetical protein H0235_007808 [Vespula pensylvanica]